MMEATGIVRVKICCIASVEEAALAVRCGASAVGLVSAMPSGPGVIGEERIAEIAGRVAAGVGTFLLTSRQSVGGIVEQVRRTGVNTVQICDRLVEGSYGELCAELPGVRLVQVIHVMGEASIGEAARVAEFVDAVLLDSGNQGLAVKELGGTGRRHDWRVSRRIREEVGVPVYLAGGLNVGNVGEAIEEVGPFGVDVCSGVRAEGRLDEGKLRGFMGGVRGGEES